MLDETIKFADWDKSKRLLDCIAPVRFVAVPRQEPLLADARRF
jgi:hypothetical protein